MTYYVLGLTVTTPQGRTWQVAPHLSGLSAAEGGFTTPLGWFGVKWTARKNVFTLNIEVPKGTTGVVKVPVAGKMTVNGKAQRGGSRQLELNGGKHVVVIVAAGLRKRSEANAADGGMI